MRAAAFVALERPARDHAGHHDHVTHRTREAEVLVRPIALVEQTHVLVTALKLVDLVQRGRQILVVTHHGDVARHPVAQLLVQRVRILLTLRTNQLVHPRLMGRHSTIVERNRLIIGAAGRQRTQKRFYRRRYVQP